MKKQLTILLLSFAAIIIHATEKDMFPVQKIQLSESFRAPLQLLLDERIRGVFGIVPEWMIRTNDEPTLAETEYDIDAYSLENMKMLSDQGFNLILSTFGPWENGSGLKENIVPATRFLGEACGRFHLRCLVTLQFSQHRDGYRKYCNGAGKTCETLVCPSDWSYWENELLYRSLIVARAARDYPMLAGIVLDLEMYCQDGSRYPGPCMCDDCFSEFLDHADCRGLAKGLSADKRAEWLRQNNLDETYRRYYEWRNTQTCERFRQAIHAINPDMILGYTPEFEWLPGCSRGLGTADMPVLVFSEKEYWTGYRPAIGERRKQIKQDGYPVLYLPGIWCFKFNPDQMPGHLFRMAFAGDGMWLYGYDTILLAAHDAPGTPRRGMRANTTAADYFRGMSQCNDAIAKRNANPDFQPDFSMPSLLELPPKEAVLVKHEGVPPVLDGRLDDDVWKEAATLEYVDSDNNDQLALGHVIRVAFDDECLYIGASLPEPDMTTDRDKTECYYLGVGGSALARYTFDVSGNCKAELCYANRPAWKSGFQWRIERLADRWILEAAIPWSDLGPVNREHLPFNAVTSRDVSHIAWNPLFGESITRHLGILNLQW